MLDIDYRPVLWGLTSPGMGEQRFVAVRPGQRASADRDRRDCDLVVGTEEEIHIAGGSTDTLKALRDCAQLTRGDAGRQARRRWAAWRSTARSPSDIEQGLKGPGFPVEVFNVLGAGDAFMAGFLRGWLRTSRSSAAAPGPTPAAPSSCRATAARRPWPAGTELQHFIAHGSPTPRLREDALLEHLHRATTRTRRWHELGILAFDHRTQLEEIAARHGPRHGAHQALQAR